MSEVWGWCVVRVKMAQVKVLEDVLRLVKSREN